MSKNSLIVNLWWVIQALPPTMWISLTAAAAVFPLALLGFDAYEHHGLPTALATVFSAVYFLVILVGLLVEIAVKITKARKSRGSDTTP